MKIKETADRLNISARTVRFYEEKGLIHPAKDEHNQYRTFTEQDIWRIQTILALREAGMSLEDIKHTLAHSDAHNTDELLYHLELQRSLMFAKWVELKQMIDTSDTMINLIKQNNVIPFQEMFQLAEGAKQLREQRAGWEDKWNFDQLAAEHDHQVHAENAEYRDYREALERIVQWVAPEHGEEGLDIGVGTGNLAGMLLPYGAAMFGVDQSREMLRQCNRKFPKPQTRLGNFLALPFVNQQFDFIVSSFALHHLTDVQKKLAIEEMRRVLKPHGRICIADFMLPDYHEEDFARDEEHFYPLRTKFADWLGQLGYTVKYEQINELLHIIYAVPASLYAADS